MKYSYSNVSTFSQCPYRWFLQYRERVKTIPDTDPGNALWLGLGLHKGIECGVEAGIAEYKSHFNLISNDHLNWIQQLEYQIPRVIDLLPEGGEHELKIETDNFVGFVDYVFGDTLYDFKFSNNVENYQNSPQLSIYKHYLEKVRPDIKINHLKYIMVPKVMIRQRLKAKPPETLTEFRNRLQEHLEASQLQVVEVKFNPDNITRFQECCQYLNSVNEFPKNSTKLCGWCPYQLYCESNGRIDWNII